MSPFDEQGVFGPKTLAILTRAYKDACRELQQASPCASHETQQALAKRIIDRAKKGERNPNRLKLYGLRGLIQSG
jgi:hypothetical protein